MFFGIVKFCRMEADVVKHCYNCGKTFRTPAELIRHKNRKTPCLIREIAEGDKKNPLRCMYCNKISTKKSHLDRHLTTCKVKNGGLDKLHGKVKYEEQMCIMQEESNRKIDDVQKIVAAQAELLTAMQASHEAMAKELETLRRGTILPQTQNITVNNTMVNNGPVAINVNNYTSPNADHLLTFTKFNEIFMKEFAGLPVEIVYNLYFDINHPENMSLHLVNKSTGEMLTMCEGGWKTMNIDDVSAKIRAVGYKIAEKGIKLYRKNLKYSDADYVCGNIMSNVNHPGTTERDIKEIKEKIVENREITGSIPHIAAKIAAARSTGRVRKINTLTSSSANMLGDNIVE